jgi:hypothetical protein
MAVHTQTLPTKSLVYPARYFDHPIDRYNQNALIRALRPLEDAEVMQARLTKLPEYCEDDRHAPRAKKVLELLKLSTFYVGFPRVVELHETIFGMICEGYASRVPYSVEDIARRQALLDMSEDEVFFDDDLPDTNGAELSAALIGVPGIGKSKAVKKVTAPYRRVIYHADLDIYQIPALLIEMPYKGASINALAHGIIRAIHKLFPQGNYYNLYLKGRSNAEVLFMDAVQLMQIHYVGILVVDEAQNKDYEKQGRQPSNATKGQSPLITLLITATNQSNVPILMTGTPEMHDLTASRMSMVRRICGRGMQLWKPMSLPKVNAAGDVVDMGEFDVFLTMLWEYQWTKTRFEMTQRMRNLFYFYTQGISDVIIKLFHDVQLRAVRAGGDEIVDEALIIDVANNELKALTALTGAMRDMDYDRAGQASDLAAYLRIDPHQLSFNRKVEASDASDDCDDDYEAAEAETSDDEAPPDEAFEQPKEAPTGPHVKKRGTSKKAPRAKQPAPEIDAVPDLDGELDK